ncbi:hypothetical protein J6590_035529 [Homalodisca vitripennis]|nr:hypothetical protein J6590_035529 [Homalodisca vitripennis]
MFKSLWGLPYKTASTQDEGKHVGVDQHPPRWSQTDDVIWESDCRLPRPSRHKYPGVDNLLRRHTPARPVQG